MKIKTANWQKFSPDIVIARNYAPSVRFEYWTVKNIIPCAVYIERKSTYSEWIWSMVIIGNGNSVFVVADITGRF